MSDCSWEGYQHLRGVKIKEVNQFWQTYYPSLLKENKNLTLKFLKGNHMAPIAHHELYAATILENLGEKIQKAPRIAQNKN